MNTGQREPGIKEAVSTLAATLPEKLSVRELEGVLSSLGVSRDLGRVPATEVAAEFARAITKRVDEILRGGNPSINDLRSLLEVVDRYSASLPSLREKPWAQRLS